MFEKFLVKFVLLVLVLVVTCQANFRNRTSDRRWYHQHGNRNNVEISNQIARTNNNRIPNVARYPSHLNSGVNHWSHLRKPTGGASRHPFRRNPAAPRTPHGDRSSPRRDSDSRLSRMDEVLSKLDQTNEELIRELEESKEEVQLSRSARHRQDSRKYRAPNAPTRRISDTRNILPTNPSSGGQAVAHGPPDGAEDDLLHRGFGSFTPIANTVLYQNLSGRIHSPSPTGVYGPSYQHRNLLGGGMEDGRMLVEDSLSGEEEDLEQTYVEDADYQDEQASSRRRSGSAGMQHHLHVKERDAYTLRMASENVRYVMTNAQCSTPVRRCVDLAANESLAGKQYFPRCAIVHRCGEDAGCCFSNNYVCSVAEYHIIELYFYFVTHGAESRAGVDRLAFENHTKCACRPRPPAPSPIDLSSDQPNQNHRGSPNLDSQPRGSSSPGPNARGPTDPTQVPTPIERVLDDHVQPESSSRNQELPKDKIDKGFHASSNSIADTEKTKVTHAVSSHPKVSVTKKNSEIVHQTFERSQLKAHRHSERPDSKQQSYRRSANFSPSHSSTSQSSETVTSSSRPSAVTAQTKSREDEENLPAPSKLEQQKPCKCPDIFFPKASPSAEGACECVCKFTSGLCRRLMKGKRFFGPKDNRCIASGICSLPTCKFGPFNRTERRCPTKSEMRRLRHRHNN